jgi:hypothetical protein
MLRGIFFNLISWLFGSDSNLVLFQSEAGAVWLKTEPFFHAAPVVSKSENYELRPCLIDRGMWHL